jgi:hypothetical protein
MLSGIFCVFVFAFLSDGKMTHLQAWTGVMVESMRARGGGELSHWVRHPLDVAASISPYGRRFPWENHSYWMDVRYGRGVVGHIVISMRDFASLLGVRYPGSAD